MARDPNASVHTLHVSVPAVSHDPLLDVSMVAPFLTDSMDPGAISEWASGWGAVAGRLAELSEMLRHRVGAGLAEVWGGEAAAASQSAFQKIHGTARALSTTAQRVSDALMSTVDRISEVRQSVPQVELGGIADSLVEAAWRDRVRELDSHYINQTLTQLPSSVSANLPYGDGVLVDYGGHGRLGTTSTPPTGVGGGFGSPDTAGYHGASFGAGGGLPNSPTHDHASGLDGGFGQFGGQHGQTVPVGVDTPGLDDPSVVDGYSPVGSGTDLASFSPPASFASDGGSAAGGFAAGGGFGSSGFGGGGFGAGGGSGGGPGFGAGLGGAFTRGGVGAGPGVGFEEASAGRPGGPGGAFGRGGAAGGAAAGGSGMVPPVAGLGDDDEEEWERESWISEDAEVWRSDDSVSPAVIGQVEEEPSERPERRRRRRS